jgi:hypothetical protein
LEFSWGGGHCKFAPGPEEAPGPMRLPGALPLIIYYENFIILIIINLKLSKTPRAMFYYVVLVSVYTIQVGPKSESVSSHISYII